MSNEGYNAVGEDDEMASVTNTQPGKKESLRYQAILAAVAAG